MRAAAQLMRWLAGALWSITLVQLGAAQAWHMVDQPVVSWWSTALTAQLLLTGALVALGWLLDRRATRVSDNVGCPPLEFDKRAMELALIRQNNADSRPRVGQSYWGAE